MSSPSFDNPPVIERILTVQFRGIPGFELVHYGMWYEKIKCKFPKFNRDTALPPIVEKFPFRPKPRGLRVHFNINPLPRVVFKTADDPVTRIHQLQPDRFVMNWRRQEGGEYLPFEHTCKDFFNLFGEFRSFCTEHLNSSPIVDLCEVTYLNKIVHHNTNSANNFMYQCVNGLQRGWFPQQSNSRSVKDFSEPDGESINLMRTYSFDVIKGRLYVEASAVQESHQEAVLLKLTGRTVVEENSRSAKERLIDAHDLVVNGFVAVTPEEIRKNEWRQTS